MRRSNVSFRAEIVTLIVLLLILTSCGAAERWARNTTRAQVQITVTEKERVTKNSDSKYLVWADLEDGREEVFENTDEWFLGKFNSSDLYGDLEVGQAYCVEVVGWRIPIFSMYRNILRMCP